MHDSTDGRVWNDYLDEAERNSEAAASIGIVRNAAQNKGQTIRVLGSRRVVVAFDPAADDIDLLRTVVQLVRTAPSPRRRGAMSRGSRRPRRTSRPLSPSSSGINKIRKASGSVRKSADSIDKECNTVQTGIARHLGVALDALAGVALEAADLADGAAEPGAPRRRLTRAGRPPRRGAAGPLRSITPYEASTSHEKRESS